MANLLDDLFQEAAQLQAQGLASVSVKIAMTSNQVTGPPTSTPNLVTYSEGLLSYHPGFSAGIFHVPPTIASEKDGIQQYFSDRRYPPGLNPLFPSDRTIPTR